MARKTKAEAEATRQAILDAAEHVFIEKGVACSSLEEIARTAKVTRGAVYWHFRNKSDIFDAMLESVRLPMSEMIEQDTAGQASDVGALRNLCVYALRILVDDARHARVYSILFHHTESERGMKKHAEMAEQSIALMTRIFTSHPPHSSLTPCQAARSLHTQMLGIYYDWLRNPGAYNLAQEAETLVDTIFRGICPADSSQ